MSTPISRVQGWGKRHLSLSYEESLLMTRGSIFFLAVIRACDEDHYHNNVLCRQLEALINLRELHIGRPSDYSDGMFSVFPNSFKLPGLTRLVLNDLVWLNNFKDVTHLGALRALSVVWEPPQYGPGAQAQDLSSLTALSALRSISLKSWHVDEPQDVSQLTQLTELALLNCSGRVLHLRPAVPMPNIIGATLTHAPTCQDMRYEKDSKFARWVLRHAADRFPNAEVMHLGTLGTSPAEVKSKENLREAAAVVDGRVEPLLAAAPRLRYLQFDLVLDIVDDALDKRCTTGSVSLESRVHVEVDGEGGGKLVKVWERSVEFYNHDPNNILVAEFHYCLE